MLLPPRLDVPNKEDNNLTKKADLKILERWVEKKIKKNRNAIIIFNGETGSGKSYGCLRFAVDLSERLETLFTIKGNMAFKFKNLLEKTKMPKNTKPGTVFLLEEIGAFDSGAAAREWQSEANKFFFSFLQTSRYKRQVLLMNCPSFSYLEKGSRELVHCQLEATGINTREKVSCFKPFMIQCNRRTGKLYFKFLRYRWNNMCHVLKRVKFKLPPRKMMNDYETEKIIFTTGLYDKMTKKKEERPKKKKVNKESIIKLLNKGFNNKEIAEVLDITVRTAQIHKKEYDKAQKLLK